MTEYRRSAHCVYDIKYHMVWTTKYRKAVLTGQIVRRAREVIRRVWCDKKSHNKLLVVSYPIHLG
ncbi:hypothetical protein D3Z38_15425 [Clostridiales bacterium]|nr:hypothetical protein [Clostridiales bacterium]